MVWVLTVFQVLGRYFLSHQSPPHRTTRRMAATAPPTAKWSGSTAQPLGLDEGMLLITTTGGAGWEVTWCCCKLSRIRLRVSWRSMLGEGCEAVSRTGTRPAGTSRGAGVGGGTCKDPHVDEEIGRLAGVGKAGADQVRLGRSLGEDDVVAGVAVEDVEDSCR
jgi:hypothetical protein